MPDYRSAANEIAAQKSAQSNAEISNLFQALMHNRMAKEQLAQQGEQAKDLAQYRDELGQAGTRRNIGTLKDLLASEPGMGGSVSEGGNISLSRPVPDPMVKMQAKQDNDASKLAINYYNKSAGKSQEQLGKFDNIMNSLSNPNAISGGLNKTEIINALGMVRYNQQESSSIYGPSYQGLYSKVVNAMGGNEGSLSPAQIQGTKEAIYDMYQAAKQNHEGIKQQALGTYQSMPGANAGTLDRLNQNLGAGFNNRAAAIDQKYGKDFNQIEQSRLARAQQPPQPQGIMNKLRGLIGGGQPQASAQTTQQQDPAYQRYLDLKQKAGQ